MTSWDLVQGRGTLNMMKALGLRKQTFRGHDRVWDTGRGLTAARRPQ